MYLNSPPLLLQVVYLLYQTRQRIIRIYTLVLVLRYIT